MQQTRGTRQVRRGWGPVRRKEGGRKRLAVALEWNGEKEDGHAGGAAWGTEGGQGATEGGSSGGYAQSSFRPVLSMTYQASLFQYQCSPPEPGTSWRCPVSVTFALPPSKGWAKAKRGAITTRPFSSA